MPPDMPARAVAPGLPEHGHPAAGHVLAAVVTGALGHRGTHGEKRGLPHVEVEIRQDLIATPEGQAPGRAASHACSPLPMRHLSMSA